MYSSPINRSENVNVEGAGLNQDAQLRDRDKATKKQQSDKAKSVNLINNQTTVGDLMVDFAAKAGTNSLSTFQSKVSKRLEEKLQKSAEEMFKNEFKDSSQDSVKLSSTVSSYTGATQGLAQQVKSKEQKNRQKESALEPGKGAVLSRDGEDVQRAGQRQREVAQKETQQQQVAFNQAFSRQSPLSNGKNQQLMSQFLSSYSEAIVKDDPKKKQEAKELKKMLLSVGVKTSQLQQAESKVRGLLRQDLKQEIRQSFISFAMNYSSKKLALKTLKEGKGYESLRDFGGLSRPFDDAGDLNKEAKAEAKEELRSFISDELDATIIKEKLVNDNPRALIDAFNRFNQLASIANFNSVSYIKHFNKKLDDLGLKYFVPPEDEDQTISLNDLDEPDADGESEEQSDHPQSEQDELEEELRNLYMQSVVETSLLRKVELQFKLRKLEKGAKKLGAVDEDRLAQIKQEGLGLAKLRFVDLVRESLEERASLSILDGPAFDLVENKLKLATKGLKKLGAPLSQPDIDEIRDDINRTMFPIVREEFLKFAVHVDSGRSKNVAFIKRAKELEGHLERLKEESDIKEPIRPKMFQQTRLTDDGPHITEAA